MPLPVDVLGTPVRRASVPGSVPGGVRVSEWVEATDRCTRVELDGVRMLVDGTDEVLVDWDDGVDPAVVDALLYGAACRQVLLHQGVFTLHASLVVVDGRGIAVGGQSGAGKSTTTAALARRHDGRLVIDDVLPVALDPATGAAVARPYPRPIHLTDEAHDQLGLAVERDGWVGEGVGRKRAVDLAVPGGPVPVDELIVLQTSPDVDGVRVTEVRGAERVRMVVRLANQSGLSSLGSRSDAFFVWSTGLAAVLSVRVIERGDGQDTLDAVCAAATVAR